MGLRHALERLGAIPMGLPGLLRRFSLPEQALRTPAHSMVCGLAQTAMQALPQKQMHKTVVRLPTQWDLLSVVKWQM